jgi:putative flavoprotein involved in K+ transport
MLHEVIIVGAGQAGVTLACSLQRLGIPHVILERDRAFASWHNRWDGFRANTPNWMNTLPVPGTSQVPGNDPRGFATRQELIDYFEQCVEAVRPRLTTGTSVHRIAQCEDGTWTVLAGRQVYQTRNVAVCTGAMSAPWRPPLSADIPSSVPQLHSSDYRKPEQIATKSVLLVGSGSSGIQICRLLVESGRFDAIHLATSNVLVLPHRILGVQIHRFLHLLGFFDVRKDSLRGKLMYAMLDSRGDPITRPDPRDMAAKHGVLLHGRLIGVDGDILRFADGSTLGTENLTILWCTGFRADYSFIEARSADAFMRGSGAPNHVRGVVAAAPGLYFVGLRYQYTVASHDIYGVGMDAEFVAEHIYQRQHSGLTIVNRARELVKDEQDVKDKKAVVGRRSTRGD